VIALTTIEELRVHVERHPAFGVTDLMLDVGHVEIGRQQHDRDVGPPQGVRRDMRERWQAALGQALVSQLDGRFQDAFADVALVPALAAAGAKEGRIGACGIAMSDLVGAIGKQLVAQAGRDLDMPTPVGVLLSAIHSRAPLGSCKRTSRSKMSSVSAIRGPAYPSIAHTARQPMRSLVAV
jgi:hypothetical protein